MRTLLVATALAAVSACAAAALHASALPGAPQTLFTLPAKQTIAAFAQDRSLLAWLTPGTRGCNVVYVASLGGGKFALPDESPNAPNVTCRWPVAPPVSLALSYAGNALWTLPQPKGAPVPYDYVLGAGISSRTERRFGEIAHGRQGPGLWLGGVAGDGSSLVYSIASVAYADELACLSQQICQKKIGTGGAVRLIVGRTDAPIPGTGSSLAVALSGDTLAVVPALSVDQKTGRPLPGQRVDLLDVHSGSSLGQVELSGAPQAIALADNVLAVLMQSPTGQRIAWYDPSSGTPLGNVAAPAGTTASLSATDQAIVFAAGRSIREVDTTTGTVQTLAQTPSTPIDLSIEGNRVAWAENVDGHGRIRAVFLGGRG